MTTTFGDPAALGEPAPVTRRDPTLADVLAETERLEQELERERARSRRLEEDLRDARRLEAIGRLAGGVAHDFSNILAVISGYSELMLKRMDPTDPLRTGAESIRKAAVWGLNLTQHMLTTGRAAAPEPMPLDVNAVGRSVVRTLGPLLDQGVELVLEPDPHAGRVMAHAGPLEQALINLILNARDAMPGGGRVTIATGNATLDQGPGGGRRMVTIRVTDTGHGMDAATLSRAFEPYFTTKSPGKGTGLGLATVFAFVTQGGGSIEAVSEVGQGATFTIYLPRVDPAPAPALEAPAGAATILVIEAETGVRELITEILDIHGYHVLAAGNLNDAIRVSDRHPGAIALVVADLLSPGVTMEGLVPRLGPGRAGVRVLYLSGDLANTIEEYRGLQPGRAFLHKPFTVDDLVHRVHEILK
jgi:two-component system cell cycle sensor histidine kinase/response regulator CckA